MGVILKGAFLLLLGDVPTLSWDGLWCVPSSRSPNADKRCDKSLAASKQFVQPLHSLLQATATSSASVFFFNPHDFFCSNNVCGAMIRGTSTLAYFDDDH